PYAVDAVTIPYRVECVAGVLTHHNALPSRVLGAVQHKHTPCLPHPSRIEGGMLFPPRDGVTHCRADPGRGARRDGGVHLAGFLKRTEHPRAPLSARRLSREPAGRGQQDEDDGREALQRAALARSVTAATRVRTGPSTTGRGAPCESPFSC